MRDLSGLWEGQYKYRTGWQSPVSFDADLKDSGGRLSGLISEPNSFDAEAGPLLTSVVSGQAGTADVSFTKTYVGEGRAQHSIIYEGKISDNATRISGRWKIKGQDFSGMFEMTRLSGGKGALKQQAESLKT